MEKDSIFLVVNTFRDQFLDLSSRPQIENVLIFENKGKVIGVSNPHPHGQIYATDFVPRILDVEYRMFRQHLERHDTCLLCDIIRKELSEDLRVICRNSDFIAYVPYFARYSYEVHIAPLRHAPSLAYLTEAELDSLADIYRRVNIRYDNLFETSFPNITVFHNAPGGESRTPELFHFHIEFCPPQRSADKLKYMAGFEIGGGNVINPTLPESAADVLKKLSPVHYRKRQDEKGRNSGR
jgi:UDPglucose--hexose-1-phosphate uridylyltransferase